MPVKIRLQRHGKKGKPFYWIVAADARAKRDGKFLEKLGIYNPNTNPATIELNLDNSVQWLQNGAQPTDTLCELRSDTNSSTSAEISGPVALTSPQPATPKIRIASARIRPGLLAQRRIPALFIGRRSL